MQIRDRIKEFRRVRASSLRPNPRNWRMHPQAQRDALCGVLAEVGYADALLARELSDGSLELIDGHLRAETTPEQEVPVLVLDLHEEEAAKLLAVFDPLSGMAEANQRLLAELLDEVETKNAAVQAMFDRILAEGEKLRELANADSEPPGLEESTNDPRQGEAPVEPAEVAIPDTYHVIVECRDERSQQELYERLITEGFKCRVITL